MKLQLAAFIVLISLSLSIAQEVVVKSGNSIGKAALFSLSGEKTSFIDSINANGDKYHINLNKNHSGYYRLIFSNQKWLDFVYDGKDIEIEVDNSNNSLNPKIIISDENKIYYNSVALNKEYKTKSELLFLILNNYPDSNSYYQTTKETLIKLQEEYLYFVNVTAQINLGSFVSKYVLSAQLPIIDASLKGKEQLNYLKSFALDKVDFSDDDLIYSDAFTNKTIEYLSYYRNPQLPMALLEKEFMLAVDSILNRSKVNDIVYKHIIEYLIDGFKKYGFDNVINYIVDNYVIKDDICLDEKLETVLERRINQNKLFKAGSKVPDFSLPDQNGELISLKNINAEKVLLVFYASWCPHCTSLLPQIYELYKKQSKKYLEVIAISLDSSKSDWMNFVNDKKLEWINLCDLESWNGKAAVDYNIYATPTMILVDDQGHLIKIIQDIKDLKTFFN